ncbi:MAG: hypothetical protein DMF80_11355 [Acidobacteria bacterium]|nr:MAG: hypothetical protein DMF80_11355 [Acidobacteriota bacterium]
MREVALACALAGASPLAAAVKAPPAPAAIPLHACSAAERGEWRFVREEQLGIQARARSGGGWVGLTAATDGFHDWAPFDDFKTTVCGDLMVFDTFEPTREKKLLRFLPEIPEHDWNIILIPTGESVFDERFKLATRLMERGHEGDLEVCFDRDHPCFEAEVTPPAELLKANTAGRWLSACRLGQTVCVFGPWVGDGGHGHRPEIHPAERIWWRDGDRMRLVFVQDASQRFADRRQFQWKWGQTEPGSWHPWATPGLEGEFRIAFEARKGSRVPFRIDQLLDGNTRHVEHPVPAGDLSFPLGPGGDAGTVRVALGLGARSDRLELDPSKLDVALVDVCDRGDGTLQGFLALGDKAGYRYQEGEGFDAFEVALPPFLESRTPGEPGHAESRADRPREALHASVRIVASEQATHDAEAESVPRILDVLLQAVMEKPQAMPTVEKETAQREIVEKMTARPAGVDVGYARRFKLSARPHYDGPRGERMEHAVDGANREDLQRLLAAAPAPVPERVAWTVRVRDLTSPGRSPGPVRFQCKRRLLIDDECVLELPAPAEGGPPEEVLGVTATAWLLDGASNPIPAVTFVGAAIAPGGDVAQQEVGLASHFLRATKSDSAEKVFAWLSDACSAGSELSRRARSPNEARPDSSDLGPYRREYYARMLRHGVSLATVDGRITLDELRQFVGMAEAFGDLPPLSRLPPPPRAK